MSKDLLLCIICVSSVSVCGYVCASVHVVYAHVCKICDHVHTVLCVCTFVNIYILPCVWCQNKLSLKVVSTED